MLERVLCGCVLGHVLCDCVLGRVLCGCVLESVLCSCVLGHVLCDCVIGCVLCGSEEQRNVGGVGVLLSPPGCRCDGSSLVLPSPPGSSRLPNTFQSFKD